MSEDKGKYVFLGSGYDKDWFFIKDDVELETCKNDSSFEDGEIVVEIKAVYKLRKKTTVTFELQKLET